MSATNSLFRTAGLFVLASFCTVKSNAGEQPVEPVITLPTVMVVATNPPADSSTTHLPATVSTLPGVQLERSGTVSALELNRAVPNLSLSQAGLRSYSDNYFLRGIGNTELLGPPAVAMYLDDTPYSDAATFTTELLAVDRIEIFRGPQGERFGKNSEAGVINIITRRPGNQFEAEGQASYATFNSERYQVAARGPVMTNTLFFSVAGQYASSDGFIRNDFLKSHADHRMAFDGRAMLSWVPVKNLAVDFTATGDRYDDGFGLVSLNSEPRHAQTSFDGTTDVTINGQALRIQGEFNGVSVKSITARRDFRLDPFKFDPDFSPLNGNTGIVQRAQVQWSQELRVQPTDPPLNWDWNAGFFFSTTKDHVDRFFDFFIPPISLTGREVINARVDSANYALFGTVTRTIGGKLDVTLGLRLDYTVREMQRVKTATLGAPPPTGAGADFFNTAPKLSLAYHASENLVIYGNTGWGFKPGGFSAYVDPPKSPKFQTEELWASEVGLKFDSPDNRVSIRTALFYYDIWNYQVEQFAPASFDLTDSNAPRARTMGAEAELILRPIKGLELSGFVGYTHARLATYTDPFTGVTLRNTRPPWVAEFNSGVAIQYQHGTGWFARVEYAMTGDTFSDPANTPAFEQPAYGLLNARVGLQRRHWGVFLFGENLTDTAYYLKKIASLNAGAPGRPQTFGVMVSAEF